MEVGDHEADVCTSPRLVFFTQLFHFCYDKSVLVTDQIRKVSGLLVRRRSEAVFVSFFFGKSLALLHLPIRSIKYRLITKLITQFETNLRVKSIKSN
jgi:hypothetical protein